jgi:peroxiredoxin Q/BCP
MGEAKAVPTEGQAAPDFTAESNELGTVRLADLRGKTVVLYFYPKDSTPGCTVEACGFRDANAALQAAGVVVLGVSKDSLKSHASFSKKYGLTFPLLSDPQGTLISAYGAWKQKSMFGHTALGIRRCTFVIDREGIVRRVWPDVKAAGHADEVLAFVTTL